MKDILLFGVQGSGKGTQGSFLVQRYGFTLFEMGQRFREITQQNTPLGKKVADLINHGHMAPSALAMEMVEEFVAHLSDHEFCLFDGMPRTIDQYRQLSKMLSDKGRDYVGILFEISRDASLARLYQRKMCTSCKHIFSNDFFSLTDCPFCLAPLKQRDDDTNEDAVSKRIETYFVETHPITEILQSEGKLIRVNGNQEIPLVFHEMETKLLTYHIISNHATDKNRTGIVPHAGER